MQEKKRADINASKCSTFVKQKVKGIFDYMKFNTHNLYGLVPVKLLPQAADYLENSWPGRI